MEILSNKEKLQKYLEYFSMYHSDIILEYDKCYIGFLFDSYGSNCSTNTDFIIVKTSIKNKFKPKKINCVNIRTPLPINKVFLSPNLEPELIQFLIDEKLIQKSKESESYFILPKLYDVKKLYTCQPQVFYAPIE